MSRQQIREDAAAWVVRLSGSADPADRARFEAWRAADLEHDIAFEQEALAWERLDRLKALRPGDGEPDPDLLAPAAARPPRRRLPSIPWLAMAASALLVVGVGGAVGVSLSSAPAYATDIGERRTVTLADGTLVQLNTDSRIVVRYDAHARAIRLVRGEAVFQVAADHRPFLVQTPAARIDAQKARLAVRVLPEATQVSVEAGAVLAEPLQAPSAAATLLTPDSLALLGPDGASVRQTSAEEIDRALAWRRGVIALNGETLADAVAEFNRYSLRKIEIADPSIAAFHLGGYFDIKDVEGFASAVTHTFPISISLSDDGTMVLRRRAAAPAPPRTVTS